MKIVIWDILDIVSSFFERLSAFVAADKAITTCQETPLHIASFAPPQVVGPSVNLSCSAFKPKPTQRLKCCQHLSFYICATNAGSTSLESQQGVKLL